MPARGGTRHKRTVEHWLILQLTCSAARQAVLKRAVPVADGPSLSGAEAGGICVPVRRCSACTGVVNIAVESTYWSLRVRDTTGTYRTTH
eukprot:6182977-Pleurochrysis_carterae.AAC.3